MSAALPSPGRPGQVPAWRLALIAFALTLGVFWLEGRSRINLDDEGFLWYGAVRTSLGDVPVRDFQSYEPGRYYWSAAWLRLLRSDGIVTLRLSLSAFQGIGVLLGLLSLRRVIRSLPGLALAALLLTAWMWPAFRAFESGFALAAVLAGTRLLEQPSGRRCFQAGVCVGFGAFLGKNLGLYCLVGLAVAILLAKRPGPTSSLRCRMGVWAGGIFTGAAPLLLICCLARGFIGAELEDIGHWVRAGATNIGRPFPWPWLAPNRSVAPLGTLILLTPVVYAAAGLLAVRARTLAPVLVSASSVGAACFHQVVSRPDLYHLASCIPPALVAGIAISAQRSPGRRRMLASLPLLAIVVLSWLTVGSRHRDYLYEALGRVRTIDMDVRGERLRLPRREARFLGSFLRMRSQMKPGETLLVAPASPGVYALLGLKAPVWTLFFWFRESPARELLMIQQLAERKTNWALVCDYSFDSAGRLRFALLNPLLWNHLQQAFEPVDAADAPCPVYHRRD